MAFSVVADPQRQLVRIEHWEQMSKDEMFEARATAGALLKEFLEEADALEWLCQ